MLGGFNFLGAITSLDDITSDTIVNSNFQDLENLIKAPIVDVMMSSSGDAEGALLSNSTRVARKIVQVLDQATLFKLVNQAKNEFSFGRNKLCRLVSRLLAVDQGSAIPLANLIFKSSLNLAVLFGNDGDAAGILVGLFIADQHVRPIIAKYMLEKRMFNLLPRMISFVERALAAEMVKLIDKQELVKLSQQNIRSLLTIDSDLARDIAQHIDREMFVRGGHEILLIVHLLMSFDPTLVHYFVKFIDQETVFKFDYYGIILKILDVDKKYAKDMSKYIGKEAFVAKKHSLIMEMFLNGDQSLVHHFANFIDKETIFQVDLSLIETLLCCDKSLAYTFLSYLNLQDKNWFEKNYGLIDLFAMYGDDTFREKLVKIMEQKEVLIGCNVHHTSLESHFFAPEIRNALRVLKKLKSPSTIAFKKSPLQSVQHFDFALGGSSKAFDDLSQRLNDQDRQMLLKLLHTSRQEEKKGNFTFIHAQKRPFLPLSEIFKRVVELYSNNGASYAGYYPLRFAKQGGNFALNDQNIADIVTYGLYLDPSTKSFDTYGVYTLCMNAFLFGSAEIPGNYSLDYWLKNYDQSSGKGLNFTARTMLEVYGFEQYYDRYKNEFDILRDDIMKDGQRGNLLLLSLTPEQVKKWVYPSHGNREKIYLKINGQVSGDIVKFLMTLKQNPENLDFKCLMNTHYCLVLSDQAMDPVSGIKIYPFTSDESYVREWREKLDVLFAKIKQDVEHDKKQTQLKIQSQVTPSKTSAVSNPVVNRRLAMLAKQLQK